MIWQKLSLKSHLQDLMRQNNDTIKGCGKMPQPFQENFMEFITTPYLPKNKVSLFIADCEIEGAKIITPPPIDFLTPSMRRHADLGIVIVGEKKSVCPPETYSYYQDTLSPYGFEVIMGETSVGSNYPKDCAYNVGIVGKKCFLNKSVCDGRLFDILISEGFEIIEVKQGYTKCSICPIDENSFITGDSIIAQEGEKRDMEVLLIENEGILLPPFKNGFWGGCAGLGDADTLIVNGDISLIGAGSKIKEFLDRKNIKIQKSKEGEVLDIGSIIPLMTK